MFITGKSELKSSRSGFPCPYALATDATGKAFIVVRYYCVTYHEYMIGIHLETLKNLVHAHVSCFRRFMGLFLILLLSLNELRKGGLSEIRS